MKPSRAYDPSGADALKQSIEAIGDSWRVSSSESVVEWVENNVELPTGALTGRARLERAPYGREILERFGDKRTRHLVLAFGTQLAKTTLLTMGALYRIDRDPEDAMWVMANGDQARDFNKERFMPFVRLCKPVMEKVPKTISGVVDKHLWGFQNQHYTSMVLNFVGAGSPANLASRPRGLIFMDEVDKYYDQLGFDAGSIQLAEERQKTFAFPMSVKASSPTWADRMIWQEFMKTDQRRYWVPCPRCGEMILLKFTVKSEKHGDCGIRWWQESEEEAKTDGQWDMRKVRANAFYKCQCCGGKIHSFEREDFLQHGEWRPENPLAEEGRFGYNLSSLYSILGNETSFGNIAVKFLIAKRVRSEFQNFVNGWLAEPWSDERLYDDVEKVQLQVFEPSEIPKDSVPIMAVDVQQVGYWVLVRKFQRPDEQNPHGQSWLLFADFVHTVEEIVEIQKEYGVENENVTLDMARRPNQVARIIVEHDWRGIWGTDTRKFRWLIDGVPHDRPYSVPQFRDPALGTAWENRTFKRAIYCLFNKSGILDAVSALRYSKPPIWHCTVNAHKDYPRHLNSRVKRKQQNKQTGRVEWVWHELHQQNHLADCESHVTVRALQLGLVVLPNETERLNFE